MATWTRQGTGTAPSNTDSDLIGAYALDNATAPPDFDPAGVTSVRCQWTITGSGFTNDSWDNGSCALVTSGGTELSQHPSEGSTGNQNVSRSSDHTDSTGIPTGLSTAEWEGASVRGDGTAIPDEWTVWVKDKGPDGATMAVSALTVTITYTPAEAASELESSPAGTSTVTAVLTTLAELATTTAGTSTVADVDTLNDLAAGPSGTATVTSVLEVPAGAIDLIGSSAGTSAVTAALTQIQESVSTTAGTSMVVADLERVLQLASTIAGISTTSGDIDVFKELVTTSAGTGSITADLTVDQELEGVIAGTSTVTTDLTLIIAIGATSVGASTVAADLTLVFQLASVAAGIGTVSGTLTNIGFEELEATLAGIGLVTAALSNLEPQVEFIGFVVTGPPYQVPVP